MIPPVLAEVRRGSAVESVHRGAVVVADGRGRVLASYGDPRLRSFARSSIKPIQALPLVAGGGLERFGLTAAELAVICGSHSGLGVAAKIEDGGSRALAAVVLEALRQMDVLTEEDLSTLATHARPMVINRAGRPVGSIRPVVALR